MENRKKNRTVFIVACICYGLLVPGCQLFDQDDESHPPRVYITSPNNEENLVVNTPEVRVEGLAEAGSSPLASGGYQVNGEAYSLTADADGRFGFIARDLMKGLNIIAVSVRDREGHEHRDETTVYYAPNTEFFLITLEPAIVAVDGGQSTTEDVLVRLWSTTFTIENVVFSLANVPGGIEYGFDPNGLHTSAKNIILQLKLGGEVAQGTYALQVHATASAKSSEAGLTLAVGPTEPIVQIYRPLSGTSVQTPYVQMIVQAGWAPFFDLAYLVVEKGATWHTITEGARTDHSPFFFRAEGLQDGSNTIVVRAVDFIDESQVGYDSVNINYRSGMPNQAPKVGITSPADGSSFDEGANIAFEATANDEEDGDLSSAIAWRSNLAGTIGAGASVTAQLVAGTHIITAKVTDNGGQSSEDSITVTVVKKTASGYELALTVGGNNDGNIAIGNPAFISLGVKHSGGQAASGVKVSNMLPKGFTFDKVDSVSQGSYNGNTGIWDIGTLQPNAKAILEIRAVAATKGTWTDTAEITAGLAAEDITDNNKGSVAFTVVE